MKYFLYIAILSLVLSGTTCIEKQEYQHVASSPLRFKHPYNIDFYKRLDRAERDLQVILGFIENPILRSGVYKTLEDIKEARMEATRIYMDESQYGFTKKSKYNRLRLNHVVSRLETLVKEINRELSRVP